MSNRIVMPIADRGSRIAALALAPTALRMGTSAQSGGSGGNATILVGTYTEGILVLDEKNMKIIDTMKVSIGTPYQMVLSMDRTRLYTLDPYAEKVEIFDVATRKAVDRFTLTEGTKRVRISGI